MSNTTGEMTSKALTSEKKSNVKLVNIITELLNFNQCTFNLFYAKYLHFEKYLHLYFTFLIIFIFICFLYCTMFNFIGLSKFSSLIPGSF